MARLGRVGRAMPQSSLTRPNRSVIAAIEASLPPLPASYPAFITSVRSPSMEVEDRRNFHPDGVDSPARTSRRAFVSLTDKGNIRKAKIQPGGHNVARQAAMSSSPLLSFRSPWSVQVCMRRKARKEVLHALAKVGRGSGGRRPKRSQWSNIRC